MKTNNQGNVVIFANPTVKLLDINLIGLEKVIEKCHMAENIYLVTKSKLSETNKEIITKAFPNLIVNDTIGRSKIQLQRVVDECLFVFCIDTSPKSYSFINEIDLKQNNVSFFSPEGNNMFADNLWDLISVRNSFALKTREFLGDDKKERFISNVLSGVNIAIGVLEKYKD